MTNRCLLMLSVLLPAVAASGQSVVWRESSPSVGPFGKGIAVIGDRDGDGYDDVVRTVFLPTIVSSWPLTPHAWAYSGRTGSVIGMGPLMYGDLTPAGDVNGDGYGDYWFPSGGMVLPLCSPWECPGFDLRSGFDDTLLRQLYLPNDNGLGHMMLGDLDLDADGIPDVLIGTVFANGGTLYAVSQGQVLYTLTAQPGEQFAPGLGKFIDYNADGHEDFLLGIVGVGAGPNGSVDIRSGLDGSLLQRWPGPPAIFGYGQTAQMIGDLDGDDVPDIVLGDSGPFTPGAIAVLSSATGVVIYQWQVNQVGVVGGDDFGYPAVVCADVDQDGFDDVVANSKSGQVGQFVFSGRDGTLIHRTTQPLEVVRGNLELLPPQPGDPFPRWVTNGVDLTVPYPYTSSTQTYLFSGAPEGIERTGTGAIGTLPTAPVIGLRSLLPSGFRVTLARAEPGAYAILVVGFQQPSLPFFDLSLIGFVGSSLYPVPDHMGFFQVGTSWPDTGYVAHDFAPSLVASSVPGAMPAYLQWIVFGSNVTTWPGGVSDAIHIWVQ